ncbi:MAG: DUF4307 domain-containing protein [Cryobacterium sp.]
MNTQQRYSGSPDAGSPDAEIVRGSAAPRNDALDSRYGQTPSRLRQNKRSLWILGGIFAVVLTAWVAWTGLDGASTSIEARDTRHTIIDENSVSVTFEVSMPVDSPSTCAVQALNESYTIIGWKIIELPPSGLYTRSITEIVRTTELSNTGFVSQCWLS